MLYRKAVFILMALLWSAGAVAQYNIDRLLIIGRNALYFEDYVLSIQYFNQAINAKPYLYEPWFYRAVAKYNLDDFIGAEADCSQAISINPFITNVYELRGLARIQQQKFTDAIADYDKALKYDPENQSLWHNRVLCRIQNKDYDHALCELDTMLNHWKRYARGYAMQAEVYIHKEDTAKAVKSLNRSIELDPYESSTWQAMASISLARKKWKDAEKDLDRAIHLQPKNVANYINRALARINQNNLRGTMADYDMALDIDPNNFLAHYNRGLLRAQVGDDNRAITDFDFVLHLEPDNLMALYNRALLLDKTGNLRGAIRDYTKVIDEFPNFWVGLQSRAACYRKLGMVKQAEADEFRVYKAQLYKSLYGIQPRLNKKQLRKKSDKDLEKYNQLVVADEQEMEHQYKNDYRGRVQNRQTDLDQMPMYGMAFERKKSEVETYVPFDKVLDAFNQQSQKARQLCLTCSSTILDERSTRTYFDLIASLSAELTISTNEHDALPVLLRRAVAYAVVQNFQDAIEDLTSCLAVDSLSSLPYWQRAVCRMKQIDILQSSESRKSDVIDMKLVAVMDDLDKALEYNPQCAYLHYNRGNVHSMRGELDEAVAEFTTAIELDPNLAEAYYNRGLAQLRLKHNDKAVTDLGKAGELGLYKAYGIIKKYGKPSSN